MSQAPDLRDKPGAWVDLGLTLPIFLVYHLGVVFLRVQNATDVVTGQLLRLAEGNRSMYLLLTAAIGVVFAGVFAALGRGQAFRPQKFFQIAVEGFVYAVLMRVGASYVVGRLFADGAPLAQAGRMFAHAAPSAAPVASAASGVGGLVATHAAKVAPHVAHALPTLPVPTLPVPALPDVATIHAALGAPPLAGLGQGPFVGLIMSFGAGFYEELAFRVLLFGLGAKILVWIFAHQEYGVVGAQPRGLTWRALLVMALWAFGAAALFSGVHYVGAMGDSFAMTSFVFRLVLGLVLTAIFALRGFAAAVWAHALYDVWVLVFPLF